MIIHRFCLPLRFLCHPLFMWANGLNFKLVSSVSWCVSVHFPSYVARIVQILSLNYSSHLRRQNNCSRVWHLFRRRLTSDHELWQKNMAMEPCAST